MTDNDHRQQPRVTRDPVGRTLVDGRPVRFVGEEVNEATGQREAVYVHYRYREVPPHPSARYTTPHPHKRGTACDWVYVAVGTAILLAAFGWLAHEVLYHLPKFL